jgi:thiamine biosynthesis lipoprotein
VLHHLIDPRTGEPAESAVASVTVVAGDAWRAEVLAKAAFVAGVDDGRALVEDAGATGLLVTDDGAVVELAGLARFRP